MLSVLTKGLALKQAHKNPYLFVLCFVLNLFNSAVAAQSTVALGAGEVSGLYFPTAGAICQQLNKNRDQHNLLCLVDPTQGSVQNIQLLRSGKLEMALVQSDIHFAALQGKAWPAFKNSGAFTELRSIFSLQAQPFNLMVRNDAEIFRLADLKGKRLNLGKPGSGQRNSMDVLLKSLGWGPKSFSSSLELDAQQQLQEICNGNIDAIGINSGHPSQYVANLIQRCDVSLLNINGPAIEQLVRDNSFYRKTLLPAGVYESQQQTVESFGVGVTLLARESLPSETVYELVKVVFENLEKIKKMHPSLQFLEPKEMVSDGLSAPLHQGAVKYYREKGLIK